jgi:hypothetical protein
MRCVVNGLFGLGLRQVGESDFTSNAGLLLVPISKCCLAGDGLLRRQRRGKKHGGGQDEGRRESHSKTPRVWK